MKIGAYLERRAEIGRQKGDSLKIRTYWRFGPKT
jgi:hypothetical protein